MQTKQKMVIVDKMSFDEVSCTSFENNSEIFYFFLNKNVCFYPSLEQSQWDHLCETVLMRDHNLCLKGEIWEIIP